MELVAALIAISLAFIEVPKRKVEKGGAHEPADTARDNSQGNRG